MNPEFGMILCLFGFGICAALGWWSTVRVPLFQAELRSMIDELDAAMKQDGTAENPGYLHFRSHLRRIMTHAPYISLLQHVLLRWSAWGARAVPPDNRNLMAGFAEFASFSEDLEIVKQFKVRLAIQLIRFLISGVADGLILVALMMFGRTKMLAAAFASWQFREDGKLSPQAR